MSRANGSSPIRTRRTRADIDTVKRAMLAILDEDHPMAVRQMFYRLVSAGVIAKTEGEYKRTVVRLLAQMRYDGDVPYGWIADNTRWQRKPRTYGDLESALDATQLAYRRAVWDNQPVYIGLWLEKDALAGVLYPVTALWDVPLMVTRGYPSLTYLHGAAEAIEVERKPAHLYYFGDHDPSGLDITRAVEKGIREFAPSVDLTFHRVAVTADQIADMRLPTRPTKATDSRAKGFNGESVEVDATPPRVLIDLASRCITQHLDRRAYDEMLWVEAMEKETLRRIAGDLGVYQAQTALYQRRAAEGGA